MARTQKPPVYPNVGQQLRRIPLTDVPAVLFKGPPGGDQIAINCNCGHKYSPPWTEKLSFEFAPIQSADGAHWVLAGRPVPCPKCGMENNFMFPASDIQSGNVHLFGDEASEWLGPNFLYVYAFVSIHSDHLPRIKEALNRTKLAIRPNLDPEKWAWHSWEVRSTRWRLCHGVKMRIDEIDHHIRELAQAVSNEREGKFISATVFPAFHIRDRKRGLIEKTVRDRALTGAVIGITEFLTRQGFTPQFTIEAQTIAHQNNQIDYFVERIGRGLRHDLGFHYICRGKMVGLPVTAPKGFSTEMEIADLVAFLVRRYFHLGMSEDACETAPSTFGEVLWGAFTPTRFGTRMATGFPMHYFYPDLAAEVGSAPNA